ncbi:MAG: hypothetical protein ACOYO1_18855 [Bacteroidales bacterium]
MSEIKYQRLDIAASIFTLPCTEKELMKRDLCKNKSLESVQRIIMRLENDGAIYYKAEVMHVKREWAKKNLTEYEFDFRSEKQKYIDGLTPFARQVYGL